MYRVYDLDRQKWIRNGIYLSPNPHSELYVEEKNIFGKVKSIFGRLKLRLVSNDKYVIHKEIGMCDKNGRPVYEGDIVEAEIVNGGSFIGLVTYLTEFSSYVVLRFNPDEYYVLGTEVSENIKVIGNVFDDGHLITHDSNESNGNMDGQQAL